jgi:hexosaminidase
MAFATVVAAAGLVAIPAQAADPLPLTVPSVQQITPGSGAGYGWTSGARIVVNASAGSRLTADARTFASDLAGLLDGPVPAVVNGAPGTARPGDITLSLGNTDARLGTEGYGMTIGPVLSISAPTETGAFWGTRTVLQMLRQQRTLPATTIADWPRFKVRAISVSVEKFPAGWFTNLVRDMSYVKLNEITTGSALSQLTDAQILQIQRVAEQYHVKFVGWFNTTHYNATDPPGPTVPAPYQLRVADREGNVAPRSTTLDITKPAAVKWATDQIERYMDLQTTPIWHAGGDEYPMSYLRNHRVTAANAPDLHAAALAKYPTERFPAAALYNEVFNQIDELTKAHGKQMRIWNDDLMPTTTEKLNPDVVVDHWYDVEETLKPAQLAAAGHHLINSNQDFLYYNEGDEGTKNTTDAILWTFDPLDFNGAQDPPKGPGGTDPPSVDGIKLSTWHGNNHKAPGPLELDLLARNRPLAERAWTIAKPTMPIATARTLFAAIGRAPGVVQTPAANEPGATSVPGSPAVAYEGSQQVFFVGANGQLRRRYWKSGLPGVQEAVVATTVPVSGRPVAYVAGGKLHVFARGTNGNLQHAWYEPSTNTWLHDDWSATTGTPGAITGNPAGFAYGTNQHVFARGTDGRLRHFYYDTASRRVVAQSWGGDIAGDPVAYVWGRTQNVFAVGSDGALHKWWWQPSDAGPANAPHIQHRNLGGSFSADARPSGAGFVENVQDVVIRGTDNHLWLWSYNEITGTENWRDLTAATTVSVAGNPAEFVFGTHPSAERHIFVRNAADNHLAHLTIRANGSVAADDWTTAAVGTPDTAVDDPAGFSFSTTAKHVFATNPAGKLHHWWQAADGVVRQDNWPS